MLNKKETPQLLLTSTEALLQEINALHKAIISLDANKIFLAEQKPKLIAIVRLLSGIPIKEWLKIADKYNTGQWIVLDLDKSANHNLEKIYEEMRDLAFQKDHDPLTGLPNRRMFMRNFQVELERQERQQSEYSLAVLDLDHFKRVNDTWGHAVGDLVLKRFSKTLLRSKRTYDTAARLGGEEFALLLPGASLIRAKAIVQRILSNFRSKPFVLPDGTEFSVTFSAGISFIKGKVKHDIEYIMDVADKALYEAKDSGRNKIVATHILTEEETKKSMVLSEEKHFLFFGKHK